MDDSQRDGVRLWRVPVGAVVAAVLTVCWLPFYDAVVHGQITPVLTALLALAIGGKPFIRGFLVGLVAALKPSYVFMIPFVSLSFGLNALWGCLAGASLALIPPGLFLEYVRMLPDLAQRPYGYIGLVPWFGHDACLPITMLVCLWMAIRWRGQERSYIGIIAVVVLGTALWFHSYTPLIIPVVYGVTKIVEGWVGPKEEKTDDSLSVAR